MRQHQTLVGVEPFDRDQPGDELGDAVLHPCDLDREVLVEPHALAEEQAEFVGVGGDEVEVGGEAELDHLAG